MKKLIRKVAENTPVIGTGIIGFYNFFWERFSSRSLPMWLNRIVPSRHAQVVQIGSNDGKRWDPIHCIVLRKKQWNSLFVEAVPYLFEQLKENYPKEPRFRFENALINQGEKTPFYWVDEAAARAAIPDLPEWINMLASMDREHITRHMEALEPFVRETLLEGLSLNQLLEKHDISSIDIFHIDTEGADYQILSQLDLSRYRPKAICFEQCHLSQEERTASLAFLEELYEIYQFDGDYLAIEKYRAKEMGGLDSIAHLRVRVAMIA